MAVRRMARIVLTGTVGYPHRTRSLVYGCALFGVLSAAVVGLPLGLLLLATGGHPSVLVLAFVVAFVVAVSR